MSKPVYEFVKANMIYVGIINYHKDEKITLIELTTLLTKKYNKIEDDVRNITHMIYQLDTYT